MALAYAVVLVTGDLFDKYRRDTVEAAQAEADRKFEAIAQEVRKPTVTRNPEPHVMTDPELRKALPGVNLHGLVGLYFTADIS